MLRYAAEQATYRFGTDSLSRKKPAVGQRVVTGFESGPVPPRCKHMLSMMQKDSFTKIDERDAMVYSMKLDTGEIKYYIDKGNGDLFCL